MDPISQYQQTSTAMKAAIAECECLARVVSQGASALRDWRKTMVSNAQGGFPPEIGLSPDSPRINASEWPTGQQIAEALQRYQDAKLALQNAYRAIPEDQRGIVRAPETCL